jgi:hypothetical protein
MRVAARATAALPVYADMGGMLCISPDGVVVHYDPDTQEFAPEEDERWWLVARLHAGRTFEELEGVLPIRGSEDTTCEQCFGTGTVAGLNCGRCMGLGWLGAPRVTR